MGVLSILDREDLKIIYELVMEEYKDRLPEGFDRMLWGDLMIMFNQGDTADFWDTQQDWKLISWKLHSSSGVHTIMTSTGLVFHMLVESKYCMVADSSRLQDKIKVVFIQARDADESFIALMRDLCSAFRVSITKNRREMIVSCCDASTLLWSVGTIIECMKCMWSC
ncbi:hypothetical protein Tco_1372745 [Tanacetum coccineum]